MSAAFDRRGRVALVTTTAGRTSTAHPAREPRARLRRSYRRRLALIRGVVRAHKRSRLLFGVRRGRVAYLGVSSKGLLKSGRSLRRHLRYAGVVGKR